MLKIKSGNSVSSEIQGLFILLEMLTLRGISLDVQWGYSEANVNRDFNKPFIPGCLLNSIKP